MILARLSLMLALIAYGSSDSMSGTFQTCSLECTNQPGETNHPTSNNNFRSASLLRGKSGPRGVKGNVGRPGAKGARGENGLDGGKGPRGEKGNVGLPGPKGAHGEKGLDGVKGPQGEKGNVGLPGPKGARGEKGLDGVKGLRGEVGMPGRIGLPGRDGSPGNQGSQGQKGEDGISCDTTLMQQLQDRLAELERESEKIKILKPQTCSQIKQQNPEATTGRYVLYDNIFSSGKEVTCDMSSEGVCVGEPTFTVTSKLSFDAARAKCVELGGDLIQNNFGPDGTRYHNEIRQLVGHYTHDGNSRDSIWIGYTDRESEGAWKFLNGDLYNARNRGQSAAFYWGTDHGEPNNSGNEDCAALTHWYSVHLNDDSCSRAYRGLCEIKTDC